MDSKILAEADAVAGQDRSRDYGHPYDNHARIAAIWNAQIDTKLSVPLTPRDVALMMCGLKLAREAHTPKRDNLVDLCGYVKCVEMIDTYPHPSHLHTLLTAAVDAGGLWSDVLMWLRDNGHEATANTVANDPDLEDTLCDRMTPSQTDAYYGCHDWETDKTKDDRLAYIAQAIWATVTGQGE